MHRSLLLLSLAALAAAPLTAQAPGRPLGSYEPTAQPLSAVPRVSVPALDRAAIAAEDRAREAAGEPARYAIPFGIDLRPATDGVWQSLDADWDMWRVRVRAPGASHVNLGFGRFSMPGDAQVSVFAANGTHALRPFTAWDHQPSRELWTPVVPGDEVVIELLVRPTDRDRVELTLTSINSGYRFFGAGPTALPAAPESGSCNVDVVCPQGDGWRSEIPGIAAISTGGSIFCTGFMVNNTAQDARNFFMTARHCGVTSSNAGSLVTYWNFETSTCGGTPNGSLSQFNTGSTWRAGYTTSDFTLVELNNSPNPNWGITYVGWDHGPQNATSAVAIHHPSGDEKRISFEYQATQTTSYGGTSQPGDGTHVRVVDWDLGTTEPGSSGSPLFDQNHHVIGQLHGGGAACGNDLSDYYGRFYVSWTGGGAPSSRLSDWLDPLGTGQQALDTLGTTGRASALRYGTGCIESAASFAEVYGAGSFDLSGSAAQPNGIALLPNAAGGYDVVPAAGLWFNPISANLGMTDDSVRAQSLPFTFRHPGGATTQVTMCSNGYVWLNGASTSADYTPTVGELVSEPSRIAAMWMDLNPSRGGTTHFDVDPSGNAVYLTWLGVPEYSNTGANDLQCVLRSDGRVELRWRVCANVNGSALVGYSPGNGARTPAAIDISAAMPFGTGRDADGLALAAVNRPVLGQTHQLRVEAIPAGSPNGVVFLGFGKYPNGLDLAALGAPGCRQYCTIDDSTGFAVTGATWIYSLPIPNIAAFAGQHLYAQAVTVSPGLNRLGIVTSNGMDLVLDQN
ncbi:MAG: trypsin-like peptidase domain-containing protein [Planctomycetes bacterium]|nr:trypsin-like peptidase domain-containing protein [Planctomycetota bacterium]